MTFKELKTKIRRMLGLVGKYEFTPDPIAFNTSQSYDKMFTDNKFLKMYVSKERLSFYKECVEILREKIAGTKDKKILDFGCGTGHLLNFLSKMEGDNLELTGADFTEKGLAMARSVAPSALLIKRNIEEIYPQMVGCYDIVFCTEVLEHLMHPDIALKNLWQYVRPGGCLVLTVPNGRKDTYEGHIYFWSPESWKVFIEENINTPLSIDFKIIENGIGNMAIVNKKEE